MPRSLDQHRSPIERWRASGRPDWHRGDGHPPTPAAPPCVRIRTRRFELVAQFYATMRGYHLSGLQLHDQVVAANDTIYAHDGIVGDMAVFRQLAGHCERVQLEFVGTAS